MPTNDERREVAARLRKIDLCDICNSDYYLSVLEDAIGYEVGKDWEVHKRIADLIEPAPERTFMDVKDKGQFFKCSECGAIEAEGGVGNYTLNYCPSCGAKVVEE